MRKDSCGQLGLALQHFGPLLGLSALSLMSAPLWGQARAPVPAPGAPESILTNRYNPDYPAGPPYQTIVPAEQMKYRDLAPELRNKMVGTFTVAATGDFHQDYPIAQRMTPQLREVLRSADITVGNFESNIGPDPEFQAKDAANLGYDFLAPGESEDYVTLREMFGAVGIKVAGNGANLADARRPVFKELPQGLTAFIAACPGIDLCGAAATAGGRDGPKPGMNPLGLTVWNTVTAQQFEQLRAMRDSMLARRGEADVAVPSADAPPEPAGRLTFLNQRYMIGEKPGTIHYETNPADEQAIALTIRNAKEVADFTIFHMHVHQNRYTFQQYSIDNYPPDFLQPLLHRLIDNGLDMYVGSGNHTMQGIEIYKGRPIFYNLGNLGNSVNTGATVQSAPDGMTNPERGERLWANWWTRYGSSAYIAKTTYKDGKLSEIRIYPVDIGLNGGVWSKEHVPTTPSPARARQILEDLQRFSMPFGTKISIESNIGVIRVSPDATVDVGGDLKIPGRQPGYGSRVGGNETGSRQ